MRFFFCAEAGKIIHLNSFIGGCFNTMTIFNFFNGSFSLKIENVLFLVFSVFTIAALGYLLGRVTIKGVNLGTAGVFIVALIFGCFFFNPIDSMFPGLANTAIAEWWPNLSEQLPGYVSNGLKIVENIGLMLFVTAVGFIAGPKFFGNLKKNFKTFILLGVVIIISGALVCAGCIGINRIFSTDTEGEQTATATGLFAGALTSTPAFSASKDAAKNDAEAEINAIRDTLKAGGQEALDALGRVVKMDDSTKDDLTRELGEGYELLILSGLCTDEYIDSKIIPYAQGDYEARVTVGNGIAYLFGVVGVVLFVQLMPKFLRANMEEERKKLQESAAGAPKANAEGDDVPDANAKPKKKLLDIDPFGFAPFALAILCGVLIGSIKIGNFSLTTTGGCLLMSLIFGHFGHAGPVNIMPTTPTLKVFRELGLMLFLIGAGVAGGAKFVALFEPVYFLYGVAMTLLPMVIGFLVAKLLLKMNLLNSLGSITGGMTSTPALGTLINVSGTEDVATAYAATYPVALIAVVLCSQFIIMLL